jgi:NADH-quinone oxidoreductase subunit G
MAQNAKQAAAPALSTVASAAASDFIRLKVKVDGHPIEVAPGATMLDAIKKSKSRVPTLCFHPEFDPKAVCEWRRIFFDEKFSSVFSCSVFI